ncbi:hypothetical protein BU24DRAFT_459966 [Aaosphaeria arxii CBS 175.79]|uniref:Malate dehydrogenase n=1 Tax=Aaosphaeria arxii CBS 175.79 TaxID=1450172 RepID=A0A6A5XV87_9PLEO|nr:uncharacterized protein BU24DRAFT_459966 [Aaosphaeria arxii CBS 175.79]KAF2016846.1 hypothetical protein BU24DRAFT_459966 [Aaosphaeria arxii CBS 175.79]
MHFKLTLLTSFIAAVTLTAAHPHAPVHQRSRLAHRQADNTTCDLTTQTPPANTLTPPSTIDTSLKLLMVAEGRGTQNYTCSSPTATPTPFGAIATLYDASCSSPSSNTSTRPRRPRQENPDAPRMIGVHFFTSSLTPDFFIPALGGNTLAKKAEDMPAPDASGANVPWLRLEADVAGSQTGVRQIYRVPSLQDFQRQDTAQSLKDNPNPNYL